MENREQRFFKCYSWKLKDFIQAHSIYPISSGINGRTNKVYHLYEVTPELSRILTNWSERRNKK